MNDCEGEFLRAFQNDRDVTIEVHIHLQDHQSEFSLEDKWALQWVGLLVVLELVVLYHVLRVSIRNFNVNEELDWPLTVVVAVLVLETL
jgi:hypothetical protein